MWKFCSEGFTVFKSTLKINHDVELWESQASTWWSGPDLSLTRHFVGITPCPPWGLRGPRHVSMYGGHRTDARVLLHHSLEAGSLTHTVSELVAIKSQESSCLHSLQQVTGRHMVMPGFLCRCLEFELGPSGLCSKSSYLLSRHCHPSLFNSTNLFKSPEWHYYLFLKSSHMTALSIKTDHDLLSIDCGLWYVFICIVFYCSRIFCQLFGHFWDRPYSVI